MTLRSISAPFRALIAADNEDDNAAEEPRPELEGISLSVLMEIPLILFARAANAIPLSLLGFIQYLSPTIALLTGVFLFGEPFTVAHAVCLGCIWAGLALVTLETLRRTR